MGIERCPTCGGRSRPASGRPRGLPLERRPRPASRSDPAHRGRHQDRGAASLLASAYAYVPTLPKPSGWKLRLEEEPGKGPTAKQVGMALAALVAGGFRGQKVSIPADPPFPP